LLCESRLIIAEADVRAQRAPRSPFWDDVGSLYVNHHCCPHRFESCSFHALLFLVMTIPAIRNKACHNCRRKRLKCDRNVPSCLKCAQRGYECLGYQSLSRWDQGLASRGKLRGTIFESLAKTKERSNLHESRLLRFVLFNAFALLDKLKLICVGLSLIHFCKICATSREDICLTVSLYVLRCFWNATRRMLMFIPH
jgi:hypothetical protein